jgi:gluconate kinase
LIITNILQCIPSSSRNPFATDIMSTSYSEISSAAAMNQNYEKMDVGEDLMDEEREYLRNRPDSLYDPYEAEGQCMRIKHGYEDILKPFYFSYC